MYFMARIEGTIHTMHIYIYRPLFCDNLLLYFIFFSLQNKKNQNVGIIEREKREKKKKETMNKRDGEGGIVLGEFSIYFSYPSRNTICLVYTYNSKPGLKTPPTPEQAGEISLITRGVWITSPLTTPRPPPAPSPPSAVM